MQKIARPELIGYLKDDLRRANVLMNSGIHTEEALSLYTGVIKICESADSLSKYLMKSLADAYEGKYYSLKRLKKESEADIALKKCDELSDRLRESSGLH